MTDKLNPASLSIEQAVQVLTAAGSVRVTVQEIKNDIEAGAPLNLDGTINLIHYAAWLVKKTV